jgi:ComF family protein
MLPCFRKLLANLADICFPPRCLSCRVGLAAGDPLFFCAACRADILLLQTGLCHCCGTPFPVGGESHYCGSCLAGRNSFDAARSVVIYKGAARDAVHALKYERYAVGVDAFGMLFREVFADPCILAADLIIPVPLHVQRLRQRGFNQSMILARQFFPAFLDRIKPRALIRQRNTVPQTSLSRHQRLANIRGAFLVPQPDIVKGKSVILVDDIYTTGATINECARVLRRAGAIKIMGLTFARVAEH